MMASAQSRIVSTMASANCCPLLLLPPSRDELLPIEGDTLPLDHDLSTAAGLSMLPPSSVYLSQDTQANPGFQEGIPERIPSARGRTGPRTTRAATAPGGPLSPVDNRDSHLQHRPPPGSKAGCTSPASRCQASRRRAQDAEVCSKLPPTGTGSASRESAPSLNAG